MPAPITIELMDGFLVRVGARRIPADAWPTRRAAQLVQLLALTDRRRLAREQAIEALWPHLDPDAGAANLRKAAHHARRTLGDPEAVVLRAGLAQLFPGRQVATDVEAFERTGDPDLYRGELLPDARYESWAQAARERLHDRYVESLRREGRLERLVELEPTDEPACRELMRRELDRGSLPGAIAWFGRLRSALRRELGVSPSAATVALYDSAVAGLGDAETAFVGRELELARVTAALRGGGQQQAIVLTGPAGNRQVGPLPGDRATRPRRGLAGARRERRRGRRAIRTAGGRRRAPGAAVARAAGDRGREGARSVRAAHLIGGSRARGPTQPAPRHRRPSPPRSPPPRATAGWHSSSTTPTWPTRRRSTPCSTSTPEPRSRSC